MTEEDSGELDWFSTEREARKFLLAKAYARLRTAARVGDEAAQADRLPENRGATSSLVRPYARLYASAPGRLQE
jgi:hypothetical protein